MCDWPIPDKYLPLLKVNKPKITLTLNRNHIKDGESITVRWLVENAEKITLSGVYPRPIKVNSSGTETFLPNESDEVSIIATNAMGESSTAYRSYTVEKKSTNLGWCICLIVLMVAIIGVLIYSNVSSSVQQSSPTTTSAPLKYATEENSPDTTYKNEAQELNKLYGEVIKSLPFVCKENIDSIATAIEKYNQMKIISISDSITLKAKSEIEKKIELSDKENKESLKMCPSDRLKSKYNDRINKLQRYRNSLK